MPLATPCEAIQRPLTMPHSPQGQLAAPGRAWPRPRVTAAIDGLRIPQLSCILAPNLPPPVPVPLRPRRARQVLPFPLPLSHAACALGNRRCPSPGVTGFFRVVGAGRPKVC